MNEKSKAWICLIVAGLSEAIWAYTMKLSCGFTVLLPSIITALVLIAGFFLLAKAVQRLGIGTSYAVFTGIGIVCTAVEGVLLFDEGMGVLKLVSLALLCGGIIGLKTEEKG